MAPVYIHALYPGRRLLTPNSVTLFNGLLLWSRLHSTSPTAYRLLRSPPVDGVKPRLGTRRRELESRRLREEVVPRLETRRKQKASLSPARFECTTLLMFFLLSSFSSFLPGVSSFPPPLLPPWSLSFLCFHSRHLSLAAPSSFPPSPAAPVSRLPLLRYCCRHWTRCWPGCSSSSSSSYASPLLCVCWRLRRSSGSTGSATWIST